MQIFICIILHLVGFLLTLYYDARNHELKRLFRLYRSFVLKVNTLRFAEKFGSAFRLASSKTSVITCLFKTVSKPGLSTLYINPDNVKLLNIIIQ